MAYKTDLGYTSPEMQEIYTGTSTEPIITIDAVNRTMSVDPVHRIAGVVGDHNSNPVRFRCPRYIDGGDILTCNKFAIVWQNPQAETEGATEIDDVRADPSASDYVIGTWLVEYDTCAAEGPIDIWFRAQQEDAEGLTVYEWKTLKNSEMEIYPGANEGYSTPDNMVGGGSFAIDEDELNGMIEEVLYGISVGA